LFACGRVTRILDSVISVNSWSKNLDGTIRPECQGMLVADMTQRRLQWAQAFHACRELPICRVAMWDCKVTKSELVELVETLQQEPILKTDDKENGNEN
jgi:hypothetical protein